MSKYKQALTLDISAPVPLAPVSPVGVVTFGPDAENPSSTRLELDWPFVYNNEDKLSTLISASVLLGRYSPTTGIFQEIQIGSGLEFSGNQLRTIASMSTGTVTVVSVASANGFSGTVSNPSTTPAITIQTTVSGLLKGVGASIVAAVPGTDFVNPAGLTSALSSYYNLSSNTLDDITAGTTNKHFTDTEKTKLAGIATGATANDTDANLKNRANHTGTQTSSTISDFQSSVSLNTDVSANTIARHTHANKALLDTYTQTEANLADAVSKKHVAVTFAGTGIYLTLSGQEITVNPIQLDNSSHVTNSLPLNKIAALTINRALVSDGSGFISASSVTSTELGYLSGVTSAIQTQINTKQATITGGATSILSSDLTINRALISDGSGKVSVSGTTSTELGYLSGVTSAIQTQINGITSNVTHTGEVTGATALTLQKEAITNRTAVAIASGDFVLYSDISDTNNLKKSTIGDVMTNILVGAISSTLTTNATANRALISDGSGKFTTHSTTTSTELGYLSGVTSAIQTQINGKQATITGAASTITTSNLATSVALVSDGSGKVAASSVTSTELGYLSGVTSAIQTQINTINSTLGGLTDAVVLKGTWDASSGSFPGSGSAKAGWSYIVSVTGTVNSVTFNQNDRILAIVNNASTSTFAGNWHKLDYTDQVLSVNSQTGAVVLNADNIDDSSTSHKFVTSADLTKLSNLSGTNSGDQTITLTGDITGSGTGSFAATIANSSVTLAKMANVATGTVFYRKTASSGAPEVQTLATLKTDLGLTGTNSGDQTITLTGEVTGSGTGSFTATIDKTAITNRTTVSIDTADLILFVDVSDSNNLKKTTLLDALSFVSGSGITSLNSLNTAAQTFATGTSGTDFGINSSGSTHTFNLPDASTSNRGVVTNAAQTFGGAKTFDNGVVIGLTSGRANIGNNNSPATSQTAYATGDFLTIGLSGTSSNTNKTTIIFNNNGRSDPSSANATANGDKIVLWNESGVKAAIGLNTSNNLWLQGQDAIKLYTGTTQRLHIANDWQFTYGGQILFYNGGDKFIINADGHMMYCGNEGVIKTNNNSKYITLTGGGDKITTSSGLVTVYGITNGTNPGKVIIEGADVSTGDVIIKNTHASAKVSLQGNVEIVPQLSPASGGVPTGVVNPYVGTSAPAGWLLSNGQTIGNASSGATGRANDDTVNLFTLLWNSMANSQAPVSGGRGASASADFSANKTITLPDMRQRFPLGTASSGTGSTHGGTGGNIDHNHTVPAHYHGLGTGSTLATGNPSIDMSAHNHGVNQTSAGSHTHTITLSGVTANHTHTYSGTTGGGGNHSHTIATTNAGPGSGTQRVMRASTGTNADVTAASTVGDHTHTFSGTTSTISADHSHNLTGMSDPGNHTHSVSLNNANLTHTHTITGTIGLVTGGVDGNASMTSGNNNPPFLALNYIIKL